MRKIYIILSNTDTTLSKLIKKYLDYEYNHVSISLDKKLNKMYSFGRIDPENPLVGGFIRECPDTGTLSYFDTKIKIFELKITEEQYLKIEKDIDYFLENKADYMYNTIGLIGIMLNKSLKAEASYFCSEFVAEILKKNNIYSFNKPIGLITPEDYEVFSPFLIYEGELKEYRNLLVSPKKRKTKKKSTSYSTKVNTTYKYYKKYIKKTFKK